MSSTKELDVTVPYKDTASIKFNYIRFPQYRIACKLRHFQKISNFALIDQFNTLESFREFGLNGNPDLHSKIANSQVYSMLTFLFEQLSQRLPPNQVINPSESTVFVFNWFRDVLDSSTSGFMNVFDVKVVATLLCQSTYQNKLRYIFTLISESFVPIAESSGSFIANIAAIVSYFEGDSFQATQPQSNDFRIADPNEFLAKFSRNDDDDDVQSELTSWLVIYHRLPDVENIHHDDACSACRVSSFTGFRYKCKECSHYSLCQECFWSGRSSGSHNPDKHSCKEYVVDKKVLRGSLRRSFRNSFRRKPKKAVVAPATDEILTEKVFNMSNIITSPLTKRRQMLRKNSCEFKLQDYYHQKSTSIPHSMTLQSDEHTTIKHYLAIVNDISAKPTPMEQSDELTSQFEKTIHELENRNRDLAAKIAEMKNRKQMCNTKESKEAIYEDLHQLRQKQNALEVHLKSLQDRRQTLMMQLDEVMKSLAIDQHCIDEFDPNNESGEFVHL